MRRPEFSLPEMDLPQPPIDVRQVYGIVQKEVKTASRPVVAEGLGQFSPLAQDIGQSAMGVGLTKEILNILYRLERGCVMLMGFDQPALDACRPSQSKKSVNGSCFISGAAREPKAFKKGPPRAGQVSREPPGSADGPDLLDAQQLARGEDRGVDGAPELALRRRRHHERHGLIEGRQDFKGCQITFTLTHSLL